MQYSNVGIMIAQAGESEAINPPGQHAIAVSFGQAGTGALREKRDVVTGLFDGFDYALLALFHQWIKEVLPPGFPEITDQARGLRAKIERDDVWTIARLPNHRENTLVHVGCHAHLVAEDFRNRPVTDASALRDIP
jgi:hypothetical protein